jgi:hypothetical protein
MSCAFVIAPMHALSGPMCSALLSRQVTSCPCTCCTVCPMFPRHLVNVQSAREGLSRIPGISLMDLSHTGSLAPAPQVSPALPQAMQQLAQQGSGATSQQPQQQQQHQHQQQGEGVPAPAWKAFAMQETQAGSHEPERQAPSQHLRSVAGWDPLRVVVGVEGLGGLSGFQVAERLEKEHHIVPELATHKVRNLTSHSAMSMLMCSQQFRLRHASSCAGGAGSGAFHHDTAPLLTTPFLHGYQQALTAWHVLVCRSLCLCWVLGQCRKMLKLW